MGIWLQYDLWFCRRRWSCSILGWTQYGLFSQDHLWIFLLAANVAEGYSWILMGFSWLLSEWPNTSLDGMTWVNPANLRSFLFSYWFANNGVIYPPEYTRNIRALTVPWGNIRCLFIIWTRGLKLTPVKASTLNSVIHVCCFYFYFYSVFYRSAMPYWTDLHRLVCFKLVSQVMGLQTFIAKDLKPLKFRENHFAFVRAFKMFEAWLSIQLYTLSLFNINI